MGSTGGWNRPAANQPTVKKGGAKAPSKVKGIVAGLVVVCALGGLCLWMFSGDDGELKAKPDRERGLIKEVKPAVVQTNVAKVVAAEEEDPNGMPTKIGQTKNGYIKLANGKLHKVRGVTKVDMTTRKARYEIFDYYSENEIACLLSLEPGQYLLGTPPYNGNFKKDFEASLKSLIMSSPDDTPEQTELRRAVKEAKLELKAAMDRGEDIEQIMLDSRRECQKLVEYKLGILSQVDEYKKGEAVTDQDVEDFVQAANKMLEEKGIAPLQMGPITRQKIKMERLKEMEQEGMKGYSK